MVQNNYGGVHEVGIISNALLSIGIVLTLVSTLFLGIKLRWFRYRMNIMPRESPVLLRAHSVTEIRENCSVGQYRQSLQDEDTQKIRVAGNESHQTPSPSPSPSSYGVKSKSDRESIFRWPFKNKLSLSKSQSMKDDQRRVEVIRSTSAPPPESPSREYSERVAHDMAIAEKNERIKRSISERLHTNNSTSMPDLVQRDEFKRPPSPVVRMMTIQKEIEVSLEHESDEYQTIDEVEEITSAETLSETEEAKVSLENNERSISIEKEEDEDAEVIVQARPPTPIRRRSRSNSIKNSQLTATLDSLDSAAPENPPAVMPRKKHIQASNTVEPANLEAKEEEISVSRRTSIDVAPKSILKNGETSAQPSNATVHFINVPESSSSSDDEYYDETQNFSVWQQIDMHREQLTRTFKLSSDYEHSAGDDDDDAPPPLPVTPPPRYEPDERDFSFA